MDYETMLAYLRCNESEQQPQLTDRQSTLAEIQSMYAEWAALADSIEAQISKLA